MTLWSEIRGQWGRNVARWNLAGLPWRDWSYSELLWTYMAEKTAYLKEHQPRKVRRWLMDLGDEEALRAHDAQMLKSSASAQ